MTVASTLANREMQQARPWKFTETAYDLKLLDKFPATITGAGALQANFDRLAAAWRRDTQFYSSVTDIVLDPSYQKIIGLGAAVVPIILQELKKSPDHWYWALAAITEANPAQNVQEGDIAATCQAWIDWGKRRGLVD